MTQDEEILNLKSQLAIKENEINNLRGIINDMSGCEENLAKTILEDAAAISSYKREIKGLERMVLERDIKIQEVGKHPDMELINSYREQLKKYE